MHSTPSKILQLKFCELEVLGKIFTGGEIAAFHYMVHQLCQELTNNECQSRGGCLERT